MILKICETNRLHQVIDSKSSEAIVKGNTAYELITNGGFAFDGKMIVPLMLR
jgi:hypothetical protein